MQLVNNCKIGKNVKVGNFADLFECEIGDNSKIGSYVYIEGGVKIGKNCKILSHTFICEKVVIEDDVFIGHHVVFINDRYPPTEDRNKWEYTLVKKGASIGSNATILPVVIGKNALIGGGSVVTKDIPDNAVVVGNPAKILRYRNV